MNDQKSSVQRSVAEKLASIHRRMADVSEADVLAAIAAAESSENTRTIGAPVSFTLTVTPSEDNKQFVRVLTQTA